MINKKLKVTLRQFYTILILSFILGFIVFFVAGCQYLRDHPQAEVELEQILEKTSEMALESIA